MEEHLTQEFGAREVGWGVEVYVSNPEIPERAPKREGIPGRPTGLLKAWYKDKTENVHSLTFTSAESALYWLGQQKWDSTTPVF